MTTRDQLLAQAEEMVAQAGGPGFAQARFGELVAEFQNATGVSQQRARHWVAKAIRRARHPGRKEEEMKPVSLKLKALAIAALRRGESPRDAMDSIQKATRKEYTRDELAQAVEAAQQADLAKPL